MDANTVATLTTQAITMLTPFVTKVEEAVADKVAGAAVEQGKRVYEAIHSRFSQEGDGKASKVLANFVADPEEYTTNLENKLNTLLQNDPTFAQLLYQIVQSAPTQSIEIGDYAVAERNNLKNSLGKGSQSLHGGHGSRFDGNTLEIRHPGDKRQS